MKISGLIDFILLVALMQMLKIYFDYKFLPGKNITKHVR